MTTPILIVLSLEFFVIEIIVLALITKFYWPQAKKYLDSMWRKRHWKMYQPEPGVQKAVIYRTDDGITVSAYFVEEMLTVLGKALIAFLVTAVAISAVNLLYHLVNVVYNSQYIEIGQNPGQMLGWLFPVPLYVITGTVIFGTTLLSAPLIFWRLKWKWVYNVVFEWDSALQDISAHAKWKALTTFTQMAVIEHDSDTPITEVHDVKRATDPLDLGFRDKALNPIDRGVKNPSTWEMWKFQIFEWWVGKRSAQHDTQNVVLPSRQRGGTDLVEWLYESGRFAIAAQKRAADWRKIETRMKALNAAADRALTDLDDTNWNLSTVQKADGEVEKRSSSLFPIYWPVPVDLFELAGDHPDGYVVVIQAPTTRATSDRISEDDILKAFQQEA